MVRFVECARNVLPASIGFGLYWAWVYLSFDSGVFLEEGVANRYAVFSIHGVSTASALAGFVLCSFIGSGLLRKKGRVFVVYGPLVASVGTLFYAVPPFSFSFVSCLAGACVSGIGAAFLVVGWGVVYEGLPKGREVAYTALSFFVSFSVFALVSRLDSPLAGPVVSVLPCLSGVGLMRFMRTALTRRDRDEKSAFSVSLFREAFSWRFVLGLILAMVAYGGLRALFADTFSSGHESWAAFAFSGTAAVAILLAVARLTRNGGTSIALGYKAALPLIALACSLVLAFGVHKASLADSFATAASALIEMLTWVVLVNACRKSSASPVIVFAAGRAFVHVGMLLGEGVGFVCALSGESMLFVVTSVVMVVVATSVLFANGAICGADSMRDSRSADFGTGCTGGFRGAAAIADAPGRSPGLSEENVGALSVSPRCLADAYGLTAREKEVFALWSAGYGSRYIEDKLCISQATVKTHVRHIYDKIGVRSRPELMLRLEEFSDAEYESVVEDASMGSPLAKGRS